MQQIYLDNASTSFPKPKAVADAVYAFMLNQGSNINRGGYNSAYSTAEAVYEARQLLCDLFHGEDCKNVVFTRNVTESLNIVLKGLLKPGDHVLVSAMEHNAVMRPLVQLEALGVAFTRISCNDKGELLACDAGPIISSSDVSNLLASLIKPNTKAIIMTHASNVCGTVLPIGYVGAFCKEHNLKFIVDSAQTAGVLPIDMEAMHIDALCFTGHKGLLGPQGIGGFILKESMVEQVSPLIVGGTGSISHTEATPSFMPDKFEAGTMNLPGIMGLKASLEWLLAQADGDGTNNSKFINAMDKLRQHELELTQQFIEGLLPLEQQGLLRILGHKDANNRIGVVAITDTKIDLAELAYELDAQYGIATRVGLHCAPNAHKTLNCYPQGALRFSFGWANTKAEVEAALEALTTLLSANK